MKKLLTSVLLTAVMTLSVFAGTYQLPKEESICSISFPAGWKVEAEDESLSATSKDDEILISVEVNDADSIEGAIDEAIGFLKKNKVKIDKSTEKKTEGQINGMGIVDFSWDGSDEEGKAKISLTIVDVKKGKGLLIIYWASPEGEKKHEAELTQIIQSLKKK